MLSEDVIGHIPSANSEYSTHGQQVFDEDGGCSNGIHDDSMISSLEAAEVILTTLTDIYSKENSSQFLNALIRILNDLYQDDSDETSQEIAHFLVKIVGELLYSDDTSSEFIDSFIKSFHELDEAVSGIPDDDEIYDILDSAESQIDSIVKQHYICVFWRWMCFSPMTGDYSFTAPPSDECNE